MYDDLCDFGHIAECAGFLEQAQDLTLASRGPQWAILEVGRVASPFAQPLFGLGGPVAWGIVLVCEGEQVGGDFALVRLLEARQTEGPRLEESRCRIGLWRGLVRVEWTAIVLGRAILVPVTSEEGFLGHAVGTRYLLGGSCLFPLLRSRLVATGSKSLTRSAGGGGVWREDASSISASAWDEALRPRAGRAARIAGLAEFPKATAVRSGRSRMAMTTSGERVVGDCRP